MVNKKEGDMYLFNQLNESAKATAIQTYCKHMGVFGLENQVNEFLLSRYGEKVKFYEDGILFLHEVKEFK